MKPRPVLIFLGLQARRSVPGAVARPSEDLLDQHRVGPAKGEGQRRGQGLDAAGAQTKGLRLRQAIEVRVRGSARQTL